MAIDPRHLRAGARRAYELGRLKDAVQRAWPVLPMIAVSLLVCHQPKRTLVFGLSLALAAVALHSRGGVHARAASTGFVAGIAPLLLPLVLRSSGHCCVGGACWSLCMLGCIGGGLFAGVSIGFAAATERERRFAFLSSATVVAGLAGVLGCTLVGMAGMAGMIVAVVVSSLPVSVVARRHASH